MSMKNTVTVHIQKHTEHLSLTFLSRLQILSMFRSRSLCGGTNREKTSWVFIDRCIYLVWSKEICFTKERKPVQISLDDSFSIYFYLHLYHCCCFLCEEYYYSNCDSTGSTTVSKGLTNIIVLLNQPLTMCPCASITSTFQSVCLRISLHLTTTGSPEV